MSLGRNFCMLPACYYHVEWIASSGSCSGQLDNFKYIYVSIYSRACTRQITCLQLFIIILRLATMSSSHEFGQCTHVLYILGTCTLYYWDVTRFERYQTSGSRNGNQHSTKLDHFNLKAIFWAVTLSQGCLHGAVHQTQASHHAVLQVTLCAQGCYWAFAL